MPVMNALRRERNMLDGDDYPFVTIRMPSLPAMLNDPFSSVIDWSRAPVFCDQKFI